MLLFLPQITRQINIVCKIFLINNSTNISNIVFLLLFRWNYATCTDMFLFLLCFTNHVYSLKLTLASIFYIEHILHNILFTINWTHFCYISPLNPLQGVNKCVGLPEEFKIYDLLFHLCRIKFTKSWKSNLIFVRAFYFYFCV